MDAQLNTHSKPSMVSDIAKKVEIFAQAKMPTPKGDFHIIAFRERSHPAEHLAMVMGDIAGHDNIIVRIHSECLTSEVFGSLRCDCKAQLDHALDLIAQEKRGVVIYLRQEGRGIGLGNKIRAYALQDKGHDTYEANHLLGFPDDLRRYDLAAHMLRSLGVRSVNLITNNPEKVAALTQEQIPVHQRIPSLTPVTSENREYLRAKQVHSGHFLDLPDDTSCSSKTG